MGMGAGGRAGTQLYHVIREYKESNEIFKCGTNELEIHENAISDNLRARSTKFTMFLTLHLTCDIARLFTGT